MVQLAGGGSPDSVREPSTAELVQRAIDQIGRLVRTELALARAELAAKGRHAGIGVGLLGGGAVLVLYGVGALTAAAILLLALVLPGWAAALIVAVLLLALAGLLALLGSRQLRRAVPPVPQRAAESVHADARAVLSAARREREAEA